MSAQPAGTISHGTPACPPSISPKSHPTPIHRPRSGFGLFLRILDATCYFFCVFSIIGGAVILVLNIWGLMGQQFVLQSLASLFFLSMACLLVLGLNRFERLRGDH